jgi:Histidine kinase-, DNA gyrase B-, and HSP90-like ATPase
MSHAHDGGGKTLPMTVDNVGFLLDRLGQDCSPLQYLRELTQNAIEAVLRTKKPGEIIWDVDWTSYDLAGGPMKVCIVDTGDGMTGDEMIKFINQLSSSGAQQSFTGNYGVGAKIAAATKNAAGVIYQSWKND